MNDLCPDIGFKSVNHVGEQLCGDHVDIAPGEDGSVVIVLADGLGSGVKASILSTLTSKIISTMMAEGMSLEECVSTIAKTLPICNKRGVAYSAFTIVHLNTNETADIIQYDNPKVVMIRNGVNYDYSYEELIIDDKKIYKSTIELMKEDTFVLMSDGCTHAGVGSTFSFGWSREGITEYLLPYVRQGYSAKNLASMLVDECNRLYNNSPGDDTTTCVIRLRKRNYVNVLFGPPENKEDENRMFRRFFEEKGKHVVCGGTTSSLVAAYLGKKLEVSLDFVRNDIPPIAKIEGVDIVTEGVITINKVSEYAKDMIEDNLLYEDWIKKEDGASLISNLLFEEATDINFYIGRAINPAHQNPNLPINFNIKMNLVKELSESLKQMGKKVTVRYY